MYKATQTLDSDKRTTSGVLGYVRFATLSRTDGTLPRLPSLHPVPRPGQALAEKSLIPVDPTTF